MVYFALELDSGDGTSPNFMILFLAQLVLRPSLQASASKMANADEMSFRLVANMAASSVYSRSVRWYGACSIPGTMELTFSIMSSMKEITIKRGVRQGCILSPCLFNIYTEYLIREALEDGEGININGQHITNIIYADDTIILAESEQQLQHMIEKLDVTCEQYGMAMNAKKTKTMIVEKTLEKQCEVNVKGQRLTQVKQYKYMGTTIEHTGQCKTEVAQRINQAKIAFWKKATILKSKISMKTRIIILTCYVFSVLSYGCETWTYSKAIYHKINAFEMWCYRRMLRISWTSHTTNIDVLQTIGVNETTMLNTLKNRKLSYAGHIMRNTSGHYDTLLTTIEGRLNGKRGRGRPRRTWVDDLIDWTGSKRYEQIKKAAETRRLHGQFATHSSG